MSVAVGADDSITAGKDVVVLSDGSPAGGVGAVGDEGGVDVDSPVGEATCDCRLKGSMVERV